MSRHTEAAKRDDAKQRIGELKSLRDEIVLYLRSASTALNDEWCKLETRILNARDSPERESSVDVLNRLTYDVRCFRNRLENGMVKPVAEMMRDPVTCVAGATVAAAVTLMWQSDVGFLPVLNEEGRSLLGVITDRDICIAACMRGRTLDELRVMEVMTTQVTTCRPSDTAQDVLARLASRQLRRLPVLDASGVLVGVITLADLARAAVDNAGRLREGATIAIVDAFVDITRSRSRAQELDNGPGARP